MTSEKCIQDLAIYMHSLVGSSASQIHLTLTSMLNICISIHASIVNRPYQSQAVAEEHYHMTSLLFSAVTLCHKNRGTTGYIPLGY